MEKLAAQFMEIFKSRETCKGKSIPKNTKRETDGKKDADYKTLHEAYVLEDWVNHLKGKVGLGLIPTRMDNKAYWSAIDIDNYSLTEEEKLTLLKNIFKYPFNVFLSKSGGFHCYLLLEEAVTAREIKNVTLEISRRLGLAKSEIFPKQTDMNSTTNIGNFLNMPYYNTDQRPAITIEDGEIKVIRIKDFLHGVNILSPDEFKKLRADTIEGDIQYQEEGLEDMPYCLPNIMSLGIKEGERNEAFYNIGVYLTKKFGEVTVEALGEYNQYCTVPLTNKEITQVAHSLNKNNGEYKYKCQSDLLSAHCNSTQCAKRKYGICRGEGMPNITGITKIHHLQEPIYVLNLEYFGDLHLTLDQLMDNHSFRKEVIKQFDIITPRIKNDKWDKYISGYFDNLDHKTPEELGMGDISFEHEVLDVTLRWLKDKASSDKALAHLPGRIYLHDDGIIYFSLVDLRDYLITKETIPKSYGKLKLSKLLDKYTYEEIDEEEEDEEKKKKKYQLFGKSVLRLNDSTYSKRTISSDKVYPVADDPEPVERIELV